MSLTPRQFAIGKAVEAFRSTGYSRLWDGLVEAWELAEERRRELVELRAQRPA